MQMASRSTGAGNMSDLAFLAASLFFFVIALTYQHGCQLLKGGRDDA